MPSNTIGQSQLGSFVPPEEAGSSLSETKGNSSKEIFHATSQNPITEVPHEEVAAVIDSFHPESWELQGFEFRLSRSPLSRPNWNTLHSKF